MLGAASALALAACGDAPPDPFDGASPPAPKGAAIVGAAGDIACDPGIDDFDPEAATEACGQPATADMLVELDPDAVLALGDLQYPDGELGDFEDSYAPSWGRVASVTRPVPGNHEYSDEEPEASGYFDYVEQSEIPGAGNRDEGYYAYDLAGWRMLALNSNCDEAGGCDEGSPQYEWLQRELESTDASCVLAYFHEPLFSSGDHGGTSAVREFWNLLYENGADVVLSAHDHNYERFAPQDPDGERDEKSGIREFVVGTGGKGEFEPMRKPVANSQVRIPKVFGALALTLRSDGYEWEFMPTTNAGGQRARGDEGSDDCVDPAN